MIRSEGSGPIRTLLLDRPDSLNALGLPGDGEAVAAACAALNADPQVRCVILTGAGRAFSAGGDVKAMRDRSGAFGGGGVAIREGYRGNIHKLARAIYGLEMPVIAAVNGAAIGLGCDVALLADMRIAGASAKFGVTFLKLGLIPGDGGAWLLPRAIGMARAAELLFTGDVIDAATAVEWGLVSRVVGDAELMETARTLAERVAAQPPHALRVAKGLLRRGQTSDYETLMELSASAQALMHLTEDHEEGVAALIGKRAAEFRGR